MIAAAKAASKAEKQGWRAAGLLLGAVWPWTVFAMLPLNKTILQQVGGDAAPVTRFLVSMLPDCVWLCAVLPRAPIQTVHACVTETHPSSHVQQERALTQGGHICLPAQRGWLRPVCRATAGREGPCPAGGAAGSLEQASLGANRAVPHLAGSHAGHRAWHGPQLGPGKQRAGLAGGEGSFSGLQRRPGGTQKTAVCGSFWAMLALWYCSLMSLEGCLFLLRRFFGIQDGCVTSTTGSTLRVWAGFHPELLSVPGTYKRLSAKVHVPRRRQDSCPAGACMPCI